MATKERELLDRWNRAMTPFIPGGSEYIDDPERCAIAIRERSELDRHRDEVIIGKLKSRIAELQAANTPSKTIK